MKTQADCKRCAVDKSGTCFMHRPEWVDARRRPAARYEELEYLDVDTVRRLELAWAAGLFEGEGSLVWSKSANGPKLQLSSTDLDVLEHFLRVVKFGRIYGPYQKVEGRKPRYDWSTAGQVHCRSLVAAFWPYLGARRRQRADELGLTPLDLRYDDDVA